jgi:hypothetical protein
MLTIRIKTKSTKKFAWSGGPSRCLGERTVTGLREAVVEAIEEFQDYARGDGFQEVYACLVTWEDGDDLHAFIFRKEDVLPAALPWILMQSQPVRVMRDA